MSAFGGVIGVNRPVDAGAAEEMHKLFLEVIAAPGFEEGGKGLQRNLEKGSEQHSGFFKSGGALLSQGHV